MAAMSSFSSSGESANGSAGALPYNAIRLLVTAPEERTTEPPAWVIAEQQPAAEPAPETRDGFGHCVARYVARSDANTVAVRGRTPRHTKNDSAACSISMPSPSAVNPAPWARAHSRNGVSPVPYIMS